MGSRRVLQTTRRVAELIMKHYSQAWEYKTKGKPVAWVTVFTPVELLYALDILPLAPEQFSAMCGARSIVLEYLQEAEKYGYSQNVCSYSRCCLGYVLGGLQGEMPPPDILLSFRNSCNVYVKWWQSLNVYLKVPLFIGEAPYVLSEDDLHNYVLDYVVKQLEQFIEFVEGRFKLKLDMDKLVETVKLSDRASELWLEVLGYRGFKPCPLGGRDSATDIYPLVVMQGTEDAVKFYDDLLREVKDRVSRGEGVIGDERTRLMFDGIWLWYALDLIKYFEDRGAVFVYEPYSEAWAYRLNPLKPLESIARKVLDMGLNVDIDLRIYRVLNSIKRLNIDGVVVFVNRSCKSWATTQYITTEAISRELNIPCLVFESDMDDPRQYSEAQVKSRIDAFLEVLGEK